MESIMDNDAAIMEAVDENTADLDALLPHLPRTANGTFNCCNSLRNAGAHFAIRFSLSAVISLITDFVGEFVTCKIII